MIRTIFLLFLALPFAAAAEGTLYVSPRGGEFAIGERFEVRILADSGADPVSAAEGELQFNPAALEVVGISTRNSIITAWSTEPYFSNTDGIIRFSGWTGAHYVGAAGEIIRVSLVGKRTAAARLDIASGALLSVTGTSNVLTGVQPGSYTIGLKEVEHDDPEILGASSTPVPTSIRAVEDRIVRGEKLRIEGETAPEALLSLRIVSPSGVSEHPLSSDNEGNYSFTSDAVEETGVYRAKVTVLDASRGDASEQIVISVDPNMTASVSSLVGGYVVPAGSLLVLVLLIGAGIGYAFHRVRRTA